MLYEKEAVWVNQTAEKICKKMSWVSEKSRDKIPYTAVDGTHDDKSDDEGKNPGDDIAWWTNGFWGGMMWLMYHATGEEKYQEIARISEEKLDRCFLQFDGLHHDVGFMWLPTAVADYRITGNRKSYFRGLHAANLLAGRYNPAGKFIRAWNDLEGEDTRGWAIIDCMFNIPLLYWAGEETKDPRFIQIALNHADTVMENFVRPDGSVRHIVEFDPVNGGMVRDYGGQGYEQGSSWTRGQTWGMYGFYMSYRHTGKQEYLDTAKRIANYFVANIPEDGLIPVDFRQPPEPDWHDDIAAAIAACGLIEIAKVSAPADREVYLKNAVKMLKAIDKKHCCWGRECDCLLTACTAAYHDKEHEFPIIYGDYFFMEAVFKLQESDLYIW